MLFITRFNWKWLYLVALCNTCRSNLQRATSEFLKRATSATSNERISQQVTSKFLQQPTSATSTERILKRVTSEFLQQATSATSKEGILQRVTSNYWISTSNEQRVKSYATGFKNDTKNLVNFHPTTQKSKNFTLMGYFCTKYMRFKLKKIQRSHLSWYWTVMQNLNKPWPYAFKNGLRNWVNFH